MAELGDTQDPVALVPGSVSTVASVVWALRDYRDSLNEAGDGLKRIDTSDGWYGRAGDAFRAAYDGEPGKWLEAGGCFDSAAGALDSYASTLQWAQGEAKSAIDLYNTGLGQTSTARTAYDADVARAKRRVADDKAKGIDTTLTILPFQDPGEATRTNAHHQLDRARSQLKTAGDTANTIVGAARDKAPEKPGFWSKVGSFVSDSASTVAHGLESAGKTLVNGLASFGNSLVHHPEDLLAILGGAVLTTVSAGGEAGGVVLDATGVGAIAGVPLGVVSAAGITAGVAMMAGGAADAAGHAGGDDAVQPLGDDPGPTQYEGQSGTKTDRLKEHLTDRDLDAARREANGEVVATKGSGVPWDHVTEVREAQQGLLNRIGQLKRMLGDSRLSESAKTAAQDELSQASRLLDKSEKYLPRK